jgi:hypothetical protein
MFLTKAEKKSRKYNNTEIKYGLPFYICSTSIPLVLACVRCRFNPFYNIAKIIIILNIDI